MFDKLLAKYEVNYQDIVSAEDIERAIKTRREKTNLTRYGVKNAMQNEEVQDRLKSTNREKYGYDFAFGSEHFRETAEKTNIDRYGHKNFQSSDEFKTFISENNAMKRPEVRLLRQKRTKKKYGVDHHWQKDEIRAKSVSTWIDNYGVDNPRKSGIIRDKMEQTKLRNGTMYRSKGENEVYDFIRAYYKGEIIRNERSVVPNTELDLYLPQYSLAIEFNGSYWHSTEQLKDKYYHYNKSRTCEDQGIRLIHIFESYWNDSVKKDIYQQIIRNATGQNINKLSANKGVVKKISNTEAEEFLNTNHLGGYISAKQCYGLYYNNILVQVELFGKARFKADGWESIRGASKSGWMIYGGYEKILNQFRRDFTEVKTLISYVDFNVFNGKLHEKAGFKFIRYTGPDHWYLDRKNRLRRFWRVRGSEEADLQWEKERNEDIVFEYYFAGSKTYELTL